ncbi:MAG: NAD(P)/FAD-dependent oxidoreductase [Phycisphaerae bacterium]
MKNHSDIAIIGCGPAGAVAGAILAGKGYSVVIFDRDSHPRHHIGESLLPASMAILQSIGMDSQYMQAHHQGKYGARFFDPVANRLEVFGFALPDQGAPPPTFNVIRETFDMQLRDKARQCGCIIHENMAIAIVEEEQSPVHIHSESGQTHCCNFLMDATGASAMLARKHRGREMLPDFGRLAIYNYFADVPAPQSADPFERQYLTMHLIDGGWIWFIPLRDGSTGVGVVLKSEAIKKDFDLAGQFWAAMKESPALYDRLSKATALAAYRPISDYSYHCDPKIGLHHVLIGDAAGFLDPIFSSGVHLAITSAARAAEGVDALLRRGEKFALRQYQADMEAGLRVFQAFVERFYQRDLVRNLFFSADKNPRMRAAIINILAGHVWDMSNPLIAMLQANKPANASRADFAGLTSLEELQVASPATRMANLDTGL